MRPHGGGSEGTGSLPRVEIVDPEGMNLLGLLLASVLERSLADPAATRLARRLRGEVLVDASGMQAVLNFQSGRVRIERGPARRPVARVEGSLTSLLDAALGRRRLEHAARGELRGRGRLLMLWRVLRLISPRSEPR